MLRVQCDIVLLRVVAVYRKCSGDITGELRRSFWGKDDFAGELRWNCRREAVVARELRWSFGREGDFAGKPTQSCQ
jgi:hypothetical protein